MVYNSYIGGGGDRFIGLYIFWFLTLFKIIKSGFYITVIENV